MNQNLKQRDVVVTTEAGLVPLQVVTRTEMVEVRPLKDGLKSPIEIIDDLFLSLAVTMERQEGGLEACKLDLSWHIAALEASLREIASCEDTMGNPHESMSLYLNHLEL